VLAALGDSVSFTLTTGKRKRVRAPARAWMLYDDKGKSWPDTSILVGVFRTRGTRPATDDEMKGLPDEWLGKMYEAERSMIDLPPKSLSDWTEVGPVSRLWYYRRGDIIPGFFKHAFNKPKGVRRLVFLIKGKQDVRLYKRGALYRLDLGTSSIVTGQGVEYP